MFHIDAADYMMSICGDDSLKELSSPGKSGSIFYLSQDERFVIKTLRKAELKVSPRRLSMRVCCVLLVLFLKRCFMRVVRAVSLRSPGHGFEAASPQILRGEGLPRFFPSPDPTHMGASSTGSALFLKRCFTCS
jgi:hypothetical protein